MIAITFIVALAITGIMRHLLQMLKYRRSGQGRPSLASRRTISYSVTVRHRSTRSHQGVPSAWQKAFVFLALVLCLASGSHVAASQRPDLSTPVSFFTNVANYLLRSELGVSSDRISLYPTNNYTPAVHRLLQLSANLYDATTNRAETGYPYLPSVFRPVFATSSNEVYIAGYEEVTNTDVLTVSYRDISDPTQRSALAPHDMVIGVPVIIGAKKGLPNFNEFALQQDLTVMRRMILHRSSPGMPVTTTNQTYVLSVSNFFGINAWNSYASNFPRSVSVEANLEVRNTITDQQGDPIAGPNGSSLSNRAVLTLSTNLSSWPAYRGSASAFGFFTMPLVQNYWLTNSAYSFVLNQFLAPGTRQFRSR